MLSYLEFEGKDIENATQKASKKLKISLEAIKYDILSHGSSGIFGLVGTKKARIRVAIPSAENAADTKPAVEVNRREEKNKPAPEPEMKPANETKTDDESRPIDETRADAELKPLDETKAEAIDRESLDLGRDVLQKIVEQITTGATIILKEEESQVLFDIKGDNAAILIGKRGQTLEAIQYLIEKIVNRNNKNRVRVQVDIEDYLENRKQSLKELAVRTAQKTKQTGRPASVGQMNAHDRRIVHLALKDDKGVRTQSMGEGFYRKLVIFPKKSTTNNKKNPNE